MSAPGFDPMSSANKQFDANAASAVIEEAWEKSVLQTLKDYISIPNQSPGFDPQWETNGFQDQAVELFTNWIKSQQMPGLKFEVLREKGRTPVLYMIIPGSNDTKETVVLYGHMDKQPPMTKEWMAGTGPHTPVVKDGKLYGRGGADDGYSMFAAINALQVLQKQGLPHARAVIFIENCEESGSLDLPYFLNLKKEEVGTPSLIVCLDSGCQNYDQFWSTTSLRGLLVGTLRVDVLSEAVHSGMASGIVPESFRIIRSLLDRIEDAKTGKLPDICYGAIPAEDLSYAKAVGEVVGDAIWKKFPFVGKCGPVSHDPAELVLGGTWKPTLCITGGENLPPVVNAGNVLRTHTTLRLSFRLPPNVDAKAVADFIKHELTRDAPYGAIVDFKVDKAQTGWMAPKLEPWLAKSLQTSSQTFYKKPALSSGEGGSIPFMGMLGEIYPQAMFVITGLLGPSSNAHGPNEFLHISYAKRLTGCIAHILFDHYQAKHA